MKTTVRACVILPDSYVTIQRLHDEGTFFQLEREVKTGHEAADFIEQLLAQGGRLIESHNFIDDDDLKMKICAHFEYTT